MNDPYRVRVTGPLALYAQGFRDVLEAQGYAAGTVALQLQTAAQLSRWLAAERLDVGELTCEVVERFFAVRRDRVQVLYVSPKALRVLFEHLDGPWCSAQTRRRFVDSGRVARGALRAVSAGRACSHRGNDA